MPLSKQLLGQVLGGVFGSAVAGPGGALIGKFAGGFLAQILPGSENILTGLISNIATEAIQASGQKLIGQLSPQERQQINHDLQTAFRDAVRLSIIDLGGRECFPKDWKERTREGLPSIAYLETPEGSQLLRRHDPLAEQVSQCLQQIRVNLDRQTILPLDPPQELSGADVQLYLEANQPGELNDLFFDQLIRPFLSDYHALLVELPAFETHLHRHLLDRALIYLGELLKECTPAWRAFNRLMLEGMRENLQKVGNQQNEIIERLDIILDERESHALAEWSDGIANLMITTGRIEKRIGEGFDTLTARVVAQHGELLVRVDRMLVVGDRIETKVDRVLRFLEDGRYTIEGSPPIQVQEVPAPGEPPFKGLLYFDEEDADVFHGREEITSQLVRHLGQSQVLAIVGASGSGKSSLVRAGLIASLRRGEPLVDGTIPPPESSYWPLYIITPTNHPIESLATSLTRDSESLTATTILIKDLNNDPRSLSLYIRKLIASQSGMMQGASINNRVLLVVDQFEEIFTLCKDNQERQAFVDNLMAAVQPEDDGAPIMLVFVLRADFYGHCGQYEQLRLVLEHHQAYIGPMNKGELRHAIEQPVLGSNWQFEPGLVDLILRDLGAEGDNHLEPGALPLLSHALLETWHHRRGRMMTLESYAESGGVRGAIAKTAETVYTQRLSTQQKHIAKNIFMRLTELGEGTQDTRRRSTMMELVHHPDQEAEVALTLKILVDARLITTAQDCVEVSHEALIREWPRLRGWLEEDRENLRIHRRLALAAREWNAMGCDSSLLYRGARLEHARDWQEDHSAYTNPLERAFLQASLSLQHRSRMGAIVSVTVVILLLIMAVMIFRNQAQTNADLAQVAQYANTQEIAQRLTAQAASTQAVAQKALAQLANTQSVESLAIAQAASTQAVLEKEEAERQALRAHAQEIAAFSSYNLDRNWSLAALLAVESHNLLDSPLSRGSMLDAFQYRTRIESSLYNHSYEVLSVAFSPDGKTLASGSYDKTVILWDVESRQPIGKLTGHNNGINSIAFSPNGKILASGSWDKTIILWDVETGKAIGKPLVGHNGGVISVAFSPNGKILASGSDDATIILWDVESRQPIGETLDVYHPLSGFPTAVNSIAFSPDGKTLVSGSWYYIFLWDVESRKPIGDPLQGHGNIVESVAFSPDGKSLASGGKDQRIYIWDVESRQPIGKPLMLHTSGVYDVIFSPDGKTLASSSWDNTVMLWDVESGRLLEEPLIGHTRGVNSVAFSPDGKKLASGSNDHMVILWDLEIEQPVGEPFARYPDSINAVAFSPDGNTLASGGDDNSIVLWDVVSGQQIGEPLSGHTYGVNCVAFSPDGKMVASGSDDATIILWDVESGQQIGAPLDGNTRGVYSLAFSPDGKILASGTWSDTIILWDVANQQQIGAPLAKHQREVTSVAFSPDGKTLASGSYDQTIILWDVESREFISQYTGHTSTVHSLAFSPDGKILASGSYDQTIILWDMERGRPIGEPLTGHINGVYSLAFSPDGKTLASGSQDNTIILWDVESRRLIGEPLARHTGLVSSLAFSPDGETLASGSYDQTVILWDVDSDYWGVALCDRVNRGFTQEEWNSYFPGEEYRDPCEKFKDLSALDQSLRSNFSRWGWHYFIHDDYKKAIRYFTKALEVDPTYAKGYEGLADSYDMLDEDILAAEYYLKFAELSKDKFFGYNEAGWSYYYAGEYMNAIDVFNHALQADDSSDSAYNGLGWSYYRIEEYEKAISSFENALNLDPSYVDAQLGLGRSAYKLGDTERFDQAFGRVIEIYGFQPPGYNHVGWAYYNLGEYDLAIKTFTQALQADPENADANDGIGSCYYYMEKYAEAITYLERGIEIDPTYGDTTNYLWLGWSYYFLEQWGAAVIYFNHVLEKNPRHAEAYHGLGDTYYQAGEWVQSLDAYKRYLELSAEPEEYIQERVNELEQ